jgi:glycosyltransferase involved in cell wall biosynthesis
MSTHNGCRYLPDQVTSVLDQSDVDVQLHVRDDDSTDSTVAFLGELATGDSRVTYEVGTRLGPAQSFLKLLAQTTDDAEFVALCDQDDVWLDGKLVRATAWLSSLVGPAMYCSAVNVVDEDLRYLGIHRTCQRRPTLENALVQNIATGCTIVLNRRALALFRKVPLRPVMHDAWIYAALAATGAIRYDPAPWVLYRQHDANSIGLASSPTQQWLRRLRQHVDGGSDRVHTWQAVELLELLGTEMSPDMRAIVSQFIEAQRSVSGRLRYALTGPAFRQRRVDSVVYRGLCALGRI